MALQAGDTAPDFELPDQDGRPWRLSAQTGRVLVVFYPGDDTPVCTRQLCDYRDGFEQFAGLGVDVIGISADDAASHRAFRAQHDLPFALLTDADLSVARAWGCKGVLGMKRGVFLVDADRRIAWAHVESLALFRRTRDELLEVIKTLDNG